MSYTSTLLYIFYYIVRYVDKIDACHIYYFLLIIGMIVLAFTGTFLKVSHHSLKLICKIHIYNTHNALHVKWNIFGGYILEKIKKLMYRNVGWDLFIKLENIWMKRDEQWV